MGRHFLLEYRNADCRLQHIHEHDVSSSLKEKGKRPSRREKGKRSLDLFSSGFFLLEEYIRNSENDVDQREQSCQRQSACTSVLEVSITGVQAVRCLLVLAKKQFRECGKTNAYSANIEFNVSAHGEHTRERKAPTENSNRLWALVSFHKHRSCRIGNRQVNDKRAH